MAKKFLTHRRLHFKLLVVINFGAILVKRDQTLPYPYTMYKWYT